MKIDPRRQRGFALIVILFMLAIMTMLMVGFLLTMSTERKAAGAMAGNERAKIIAQDALEHAIALLDNNIPQPIPPGTPGVPENWAISPGLLTKFPGANGSTPTYIPLTSSTNANPTVSATNDYADLNAEELGTGNYPIIPPINGTSPVKLPISWAYIVRDPTQPASASNPIIGRYAFWMDDENAKINVNTAYGKPNTIINDPYTAQNNLIRNNPLDQSLDTGASKKVFDTNLGFDSLVPVNAIWTTTNDFFYPGDSTHYDSSTLGSTYANVVGTSNTVTGTTGGPPGSQLRYYPLWHPSAVNISILPTSTTNTAPIGSLDGGDGLTGYLNRNALADWVFNKQYLNSSTFTQSWRLLQDPSQIQQFITTVSGSSFYLANEFNLTAYNRAPEFNAFGKPRLLQEARIPSQAAASAANDSMVGNNSGAELEFYTTPDLDPYGPMYFHGDEQVQPAASQSPGTYKCADLTSVQMVADYLSNLLSYTNWPGMPSGQSFVAKWETNGTNNYTQATALREADQVAWNIVAMGNYAPDRENTSNEIGYSSTTATGTGWPDDQYPAFTRTTNMGAVDSQGDTSPSWAGLLSSQSNSPPSGIYDPNRFLRVGKLSGKAIMPYTPKPYLNEVALMVTTVPVTPGNRAKGFYLTLSMKAELYVNRRGPPGIYSSQCVPSFALTHFFYSISDGTNTAVQAADGQTQSGGDLGATYDAYYSGTNQVLADHTTNAETIPVGTNTYKAPYIGNTTTSFLAGTGTSIDNATTSNAMVTTDILPVNDYPLITSSTPIYACSNTPTNAAMQPTGGAVPSTAVKFIGTATQVEVKARARIVLFGNNTVTGTNSNSSYVWEIAPVWDVVDSSNTALNPPILSTPSLLKSGTSPDSLQWDFYINLADSGTVGTNTYTRSLEVSDARLGGNVQDAKGNPIWVQWASAASPSNPSGNTSNDSSTTNNSLYSVNSIAASNPDETYGYDDFQNPLYQNSPRPTIGFLCFVPTGQQRGIPDSTFVFGPSTSTSVLPDWLILDIVAPSFYDHLQNSPAPYSYLNSTMGKININAAIYPTLVSSSNTVLQRWLPLEALFQNMDANDTISSAPASPPASSIVYNIINHQLSGKAFGAMAGTPPQYDYIGELCEVKGVADGVGGNTPGGTTGSPWEQMALIRNLANLITTQSNTFHVWGEAQAIQVSKASGNNNYGIYQSGDTVTVLSDKRFESVVERSVWPGVDGVPGNGHLNSSGVFDQNSGPSANSSSLSAPVPQPYPWAAVTIPSSSPTSTTWAKFDGPDNPYTPRTSAGYAPSPGWYATPPYTSGLLINANNPARAHMTYKPITFHYITE